jgi:pyruvate,water dikinase
VNLLQRLTKGWQAVPLEKADDVSSFGSKAVGLGQAARAGLPLPPGLAVSGALVDAVAGNDEKAIKKLARAAAGVRAPLAVRSSAVDEDGSQASFAGQHLTLLNVASADELPRALRDVWWSANDDSVIGYRRHVQLTGRPSVGVVVQSLLDPDVAGVMFTSNPITGADERLLEASWGLGEAVVQGAVIPDRYRISRNGDVLERTAGRKNVAIRPTSGGGTVEEAVPPERVEALCLDDARLAELNDLAARCERLYGPKRDLEWAFASGSLYLLQCRAITRGAA